jgi:uncharacterized protein YqeY
MSLREQFTDEMKQAMRNKHTRRLSTIRLILAGLKERDIANRSESSHEGVSDGEIFALLGKMVKQREESAAAYEAGGRPELAGAEREEIAIIREFMPKQMNEAEASAAIQKVIAEIGATTIKDMGKVMGTLKERFAGQMDFAKAGAAVKQALGESK